MATRQNNTMQEGLHQLLSSLAQLKAAPDANLEFLSAIESSILDKLREPMQQAAQALAQAGGVLPPGMGQQLGAAAGAGVGAPAPAMAPSGPAGNPDELRRLVASAGMR